MKSSFMSNSFWGLISTIFQTLFLSGVFIIISRHYSVEDFSNYLISNTIYQLIVGFSSMGLGHWFIREYGYISGDKSNLIFSFAKNQTVLGLIFYVVNIVLAFTIYPNEQIRILSIIFGTNIIFDNIIYAIKNLNVAKFQQKKSALIMAFDGFLRLLVCSVLFIFPISLIPLSICMVIVRLITVNIFFQIGTNGLLDMSKLWNYKLSLNNFKDNVFINWKFVLIVGSAIIFWRSATIIISKYLSASEVANYEVSYKIFSIFTLISIVASTTIYPKFVHLLAATNLKEAKKMYSIISLSFSIFGLVSYLFIQSFASFWIPYIFGQKYAFAVDCIKQMFLTLLVYPTVFLQANLLVAMKKEKLDMYLNFLVLVLNLTGCLIGLRYFKSLSVVNLSIFGSFVVFHVIQNILLIRLKLNTVRNALAFYGFIAIAVIGHKAILNEINSSIIFPAFLLFFISPAVFLLWKMVKTYLNEK